MQTNIDGKRVWLRVGFALGVLLLGLRVSIASPITYDIGRTIGVGSVTGTI